MCQPIHLNGRGQWCGQLVFIASEMSLWTDVGHWRRGVVEKKAVIFSSQTIFLRENQWFWLTAESIWTAANNNCHIPKIHSLPVQEIPLKWAPVCSSSSNLKINSWSWSSSCCYCDNTDTKKMNFLCSRDRTPEVRMSSKDMDRLTLIPLIVSERCL